MTYLELLVSLLSTAVRLFSACILGVFAYVPCYICYHMLKSIIAEPSNFDLFFVVAFGISSALAYFLCLLVYRAATGRGRKSDGALLPPAAMSGFVLMFALFGAVAVGMGIWKGDLRAVLGGVGYVLVCAGLWRGYARIKQSEPEPPI